MDEKVKDSFIAALFIFFVLILLLSSCALVAMLFLMPEDGVTTVPEEAPEQPEAPVEEPAQPPPIASPEDLERWEMITLESVEDGCLMVAKDEAGSSASLVYGCDCDESIGEARKSYSCDIDTADPFTRYFADIDCRLENATCSIETNYGSLTMTFQEMEEWYR